MEKTPAFAVLRLDTDRLSTVSALQDAVTVTKVFLIKELADAEAARLNALRTDSGSVYWAMYTRLMTEGGA
jgi:hypothetical protein